MAQEVLNHVGKSLTYESGHKEVWAVGELAHFEYHCQRSHRSADAQLWYRDHQPVEILYMEECDGKLYFLSGADFTSRTNDACPIVYRIKFADGFVGSACEDELLISACHFDPDCGPPHNWQSLLRPH